MFILFNLEAICWLKFKKIKPNSDAKKANSALLLMDNRNVEKKNCLKFTIFKSINHGQNSKL